MAFENKVVIVTGAGKGIGRGIALEYARSGAKVVVADKDAPAVEETLAMIANERGKVFFCFTDVARPEDIQSLMERTVREYGKIDILINNAGISEWESPYDLTVEDWDRILNTNLRSVFLCAREAAKIMRKNGGGSIVNISSTRALMSEPNSEAYAAAKGGIIALTHALALSFAEDKIRVNAVSPGWIETNNYEALREIDHLQHPSKRVGRPEDIARACLYLTGEGNEFVNGTNLVIDGGMTRQMIYEP